MELGPTAEFQESRLRFIYLILMISGKKYFSDFQQKYINQSIWKLIRMRKKILNKFCTYKY